MRLIVIETDHMIPNLKNIQLNKYAQKICLKKTMTKRLSIKNKSSKKLKNIKLLWSFIFIQVNLDMTDSLGLGKLVRHMQNPSYTYDKYLTCIGLGPSILSVICKDPSYSGPSYPSSPVFHEKCRILVSIWFCTNYKI